MRTLEERNWTAEATICLFAAALAFGTLAWMELLHADLLVREAATGSAHFLRDGLLLLPLALVAVWWAMRPRRRSHASLLRAGADGAAVFSLLLIPAAAAHGALHEIDTESAHAHGTGGLAAAENAADSQGLAGALLHGAADAALALPVAFVVFLAALALLRGRAEVPTSGRRRLALTASVLALAGGAAFVPVSEAVSPAYPKFSMPLNIPPTLTGSDINLTMAETQEQILPTGPPTTMWTYNGSFPAPTIRRPTGVPTNVTITNDLPESAGSMTLHHHGAQTTEDSDGHPALYTIPPGGSKTYRYPGTDNGAPERASPQWYHDHRDHVTGRNVWRGLAGAFIYEDPFEDALNLPEGDYDVPLMVADREFDANNQIPYAFVGAGTQGDVLLTNGVPQPFYEVGDRRYRFRLYNISNRREYVFRLSNGEAITQIGTESGLLPAPVSRTSVRLGPAERADVVVDFGGNLNENIVLENAAAALGPGDRDAEVMQFRVTQDVNDTSSPVPASLRPMPALKAPVRTRVWNFDRTGETWTINGKPFDPNRVDAKPTLGTTERWVFRNPTSLPHLVHVHLGDQRLVTRNGGPPPPHERLKETWFVDPGEEVVVDVPFADYAGKFVFHCHVLEHEDDAMMSQFETVRPAARPPTTPPHHTPAPPKPTEPTFSRKVRILSSKRLSRILRRGLRFEAAAPARGTRLRGSLYVRGRKVGSVSTTRTQRGRVRVTMKLSRRGRARLRRLMSKRRRASAVLKVKAGSISDRARFTIRR